MAALQPAEAGAVLVAPAGLQGPFQRPQLLNDLVSRRIDSFLHHVDSFILLPACIRLTTICLLYAMHFFLYCSDEYTSTVKDWSLDIGDNPICRPHNIELISLPGLPPPRLCGVHKHTAWPIAGPRRLMICKITHDVCQNSMLYTTYDVYHRITYTATVLDRKMIYIYTLTLVRTCFFSVF